MGKAKISKKAKTIVKTERVQTIDGYRLNVDIGDGRRVQVGPWKNELRVDIRQWLPGSCNSPYPTKKGVSLNLRQAKTLGEIMDEVTNYLTHGVEHSFRIGRHIYVVPNLYGVHIRKYFIPAQDQQLLLPSTYGVFLRHAQWTALTNLFREIDNVLPEINNVVTCREDPEHAKAYVALACSECNVTPLDVGNDVESAGNLPNDRGVNDKLQGISRADRAARNVSLSNIPAFIDTF